MGRTRKASMTPPQPKPLLFRNMIVCSCDIETTENGDGPLDILILSPHKDLAYTNSLGLPFISTAANFHKCPCHKLNTYRPITLIGNGTGGK